MGSSSTTVAVAHLAQTLFFSGVPDDLLVNILCRLDEDPRDLARLACVSTHFCKVIKTVCWKFSCEKMLPLLVAELLQAPSPALHPFPEPPGGWASLQKLHVCCPGLWHAGVLLESWDFGLDREIGWFNDFGHLDGFASQNSKDPHFCDPLNKKSQATSTLFSVECRASGSGAGITCSNVDSAVVLVSGSVCEMAEIGLCIPSYGNEEGINCNGHDTGVESNYCSGHDKGIESMEGIENCSETGMDNGRVEVGWPKGKCNEKDNATRDTHLSALDNLANEVISRTSIEVGHTSKLGHTDKERRKKKHRHKTNKRQREFHHEHCHVATGPGNLSREQGNKLLANRFRADSLYICDWPGCVHPGEKRIYKLFRGVFKNFKSSHVWRNLKDMQAKATNVGCAFCVCKSWDMVTTFCLKRSIEFHDDGEPVVRAYVCENGHVAGAWTDRPMYMP